jgi:hypothetical protein
VDITPGICCGMAEISRISFSHSIVMKCNITYKKQDDYTTPKEAWEFIFKNINCRDKVIWCPFYNNGHASIYLNELKINHIHTDNDFFTTDISFDYIIDNPPYSCKKEVIQRCLSLKKPFALLLPTETIERVYLSEIPYTILIPRQRYKFYEGKMTAPYKCAWFCFGFPFDKQIIYE